MEYDDMDTDEEYTVKGEVTRILDRGTWIGVIVVPQSESVWERQSFLCGYPLSHISLPFHNPVHDHLTGETMQPNTPMELSKVNIRNLFWDYLEEQFRYQGFSEEEIKIVKREWNVDFDFEDLVRSEVVVDYSKSPVDKNYGEIKRILSLRGVVLRKFICKAKKIVKKHDTGKLQNTCKDITY